MTNTPLSILRKEIKDHKEECLVVRQDTIEAVKGVKESIKRVDDKLDDFLSSLRKMVWQIVGAVGAAVVTGIIAAAVNVMQTNALQARVVTKADVLSPVDAARQKEVMKKLEMILGTGK